MINRRHFLTAGAASVFCSSLSSTVLASISSQAPVDPEKLDSQFNVYQNGEFVTQLKLVALERSKIVDARLDQYVLNFEASMPVQMAEASYELIHPELGQLHLFLQPCGTFNSNEHDGLQYRACLSMFKR